MSCVVMYCADNRLLHFSTASYLSLPHGLSNNSPPLNLTYPHTSILSHLAVTNIVRKNDNHRMQMQLDLDETEACHYEDLANGLLEKIGRITEERDDLQVS